LLICNFNIILNPQYMAKELLEYYAKYAKIAIRIENNNNLNKNNNIYNTN